MYDISESNIRIIHLQSLNRFAVRTPGQFLPELNREKVKTRETARAKFRSQRSGDTFKDEYEG